MDTIEGVRKYQSNQGTEGEWNFLFRYATFRTGIRQGTLEIVIEKVLWSIRGSYQTI